MLLSICVIILWRFGRDCELTIAAELCTLFEIIFLKDIVLNE